MIISRGIEDRTINEILNEFKIKIPTFIENFKLTIFYSVVNFTDIYYNDDYMYMEITDKLFKTTTPFLKYDLENILSKPELFQIYTEEWYIKKYFSLNSMSTLYFAINEENKNYVNKVIRLNNL